MTSCSTGTVTIGKIPYSDGDNGLLEPNGQLIVKVDASQYNATSLRNAMINSAALTAMHSAMGKSNCYTAHYTIETLRKRDMYFWNPMRRWLSLQAKRDHPHPESESATWCNAASFAGVQYYDQFWRSQPTPGSTDYIDASWDFHVAPGGAFACEFIQDLIDALGVIQPEFAVADIELGEAIGAACMKAMEHA